MFHSSWAVMDSALRTFTCTPSSSAVAISGTTRRRKRSDRRKNSQSLCIKASSSRQRKERGRAGYSLIRRKAVVDVVEIALYPIAMSKKRIVFHIPCPDADNWVAIRTKVWAVRKLAVPAVPVDLYPVVVLFTVAKKRSTRAKRCLFQSSGRKNGKVDQFFAFICCANQRRNRSVFPSGTSMPFLNLGSSSFL